MQGIFEKRISAGSECGMRIVYDFPGAGEIPEVSVGGVVQFDKTLFRCAPKPFLRIDKKTAYRIRAFVLAGSFLSEQCIIAWRESQLVETRLAAKPQIMMVVDMVPESRRMIYGFSVSLRLAGGFQHIILGVVVGKQSVIGLYPNASECIFENKPVSFFCPMYIGYRMWNVLRRVNMPYFISPIEQPKGTVARLIQFVDVPCLIFGWTDFGKVIVVFSKK